MNLKIQTPKGKNIEICLDKSELDIQFILNKKLEKLGLKCYNNCSIYISKINNNLVLDEKKANKIDKATRRKIYIDILVINNKGICLIEVKKEKAKNKKKASYTRSQVNKYSELGFPVLLCEGENDIQKTIKDIKLLFKNL